LQSIGALPVDTDRLNIEQFDWSIDTEVDQLGAFDIGLMPLPNDPWTRGKGGYKLLQYGAMGLPVVASPVGVNASIVEDGVTGFLADSEEAWTECILRLVDDGSLRARMGKAGRERMLNHYSLARSSSKLVHILRNESID
jgi:glycosyltransferase involved in cell wall biosynthesis